MGKLSVFARNKLLDHVFNAAYVPASTVYLCLCTADPTEIGTGVMCNETPLAGSYARTAVVFSSAALRKVVQAGQITMPKVTATYIAPITHWAICDSPNYGEGNMLAFGSFSAEFTPLINNIPYIQTEDLEISVDADSDSGFSNYLVHKWLDLMFRAIAYLTPNATIYIALTRDVIAATHADVSSCTEESATDYIRKKINPNGGAAPAWSLAAEGSLSNSAIVNIILNAEWTSDDWGVDVAMAIVDSSSGSCNILAYDNINIVDQRPLVGDDVVFDANDITVTLN